MVKQVGRQWASVMLIGVGVAVGVAVAGHEQKISLDELPSRARAALLRMAGNAKITEIECDREYGLMLYEAEWVANKHQCEAKVTADGDLVEMEEEIVTGDIPAPVKVAIAKEFPPGTKATCAKITLIRYEIEGRVDGKFREVVISPTGKVLGKDDDEDNDDDLNEEGLSIKQIPDAARKTILSEARGATITEIERETWQGRTVYEAEWRANGQEVEIKVDSNGKLLKKKVEHEDRERKK